MNKHNPMEMHSTSYDNYSWKEKYFSEAHTIDLREMSSQEILRWLMRSDEEIPHREHSLSIE